ncbi:DUF4148 domain-containing protein [Burkholderia glumae]|uniref:DUF4148 domain-containing protein n=1 Tax=Burkholderia glumae TaxID=337 RepID=A0AAP9XXV9_BURGL|nr:DUF4148 domain-containing protein [Burkholderia glumae]ACR30810.1 Hypothetical protein bglu_2g03510 [Burkholderia glumae BGR1]AJY62625.1 hypothetical protein KS03_5569 [Burkholderia glumae LMG 2196 = ATCC 33617]KHJ63175.1 hypothetical protein NCPPB3923_09580 [Burkholderia glumae]MCM2483880.1 DUF4148 domain-containing protein [Burkholderia glumae]MCM2494227.1 DUF4148 domain-containing protein [Burkholderia glumae]
MNRIAISLAALALSTTALPAFAGGGIGLSGSYGDLPHATPIHHPSRAQVRAELAQAQRDGTLAALRKTTSYPQGVEIAQRPAQSESGGPANPLASAEH